MRLRQFNSVEEACRRDVTSRLSVYRCGDASGLILGRVEAASSASTDRDYGKEGIMMAFEIASRLVRRCTYGFVCSLLLVGCSGDSGGSDGLGQDGISSPAYEEQGLEGEAIDKAGASYVQYCNYPNSWVGTRCIWTSNTFCAAVQECIGDTRSVCGNATPTWTIYTSLGDEYMSDARAECGL
jgi:hypothetical protein